MHFMKKPFFLSLLVLTVLFACRKDRSTGSETNQRIAMAPVIEDLFTIHNGVCEISSIDDFETFLADSLYDSLSQNVINLLQQSSSYTPLSEVVFTDAYLSDLSEEDLIAAQSDQNSLAYTILNQDKVVKFGDYFVLSDIENELMYLRKDDAAGAYDDLVNHPGNAPNITLDFGDDLSEVIQYLKEHDDEWNDEDFQNVFGQRSSCPAAPGKVAQSNWSYLYEVPSESCTRCTTKFYIYILVRYRNYGVYGHAFAQTAVRNYLVNQYGSVVSYTAWSVQKIIDTEPWKVKPKCKSWIGPYTTDYVGSNGCGNNNCEFKKTFYNSTKKLEKYHLKARANIFPVAATPWTVYKVVGH